MNCTEARARLAIYRELKNGQTDITELDVHLEGCAACRQALAQQDLIGERLRTLPTIEPSADAYAKLMQRLASEHSRALQSNPSATPPAPDFLKPYLKQPAQAAAQRDSQHALAAFSSAETGPLPIQQIRRAKKRRPLHSSQFGVVGLAAACLLMLMVSGLTSLVIISSRGGGNTPSGNTLTIVSPPQVKTENITTATSYPHIVSAVATRQQVFYSGYGDNNTGWMIEQVDTRTRVSMPLLPAASINPLVVLGSTDSWLVWMELDTPKNGTGTAHSGELQRAWSLKALYLGAKPGSLQTPSVGVGFRQPVELLSGKFDPNTVPYWVHTPVQGVWFTQNAMLLATVDAKGSSQLLQYQLDTVQASQPIKIASATDGHILTSPTANSDGSKMFWSDEWMQMDGLHSNIWTQQIVDDANHHGAWEEHTVTVNYEYRSDGLSFDPQVMDDTLFLLSANRTDTSDTQPTAVAAAGNQVPTATGASEVTVTPRIASDPSVYSDESEVQGKLVAISLRAAPGTRLIVPNNTFSDSAPQGGAGFLLYQNEQGYGMYVLSKGKVTMVNVGQVNSNIPFLAVNSNTAVWTVLSNSTPTVDSAGNTQVTFTMFRWPS